jgi:hypothetical protein
MSGTYWPFPNGMNGIDHQYFLPQINKFLFNVYLEGSPFTNMMGSDDNASICVRTIADSDGGAALFGRLQKNDYKHPILNTDQVRGIDRFEKTDTMTVSADKITFKLDRRDISVEQYASRIHLTEGQARRLALDHRQYKDFKIFQSAMTGLYKNSVNGSMPRVSRAVAGNLVTGQAADGVYAYDAGAVLAAKLLTAMPNARSAQHLASVDHIMRCRALAVSKYGGADPIMPSSLSMLYGYDEPRFKFLCSTTFANNLRNDAKFIAQHFTRGLNLPYQGSPLSGGFFVGRVLDVDVIEVPMMEDPDLQVLAADGSATEFVWSLFLGRGAWGMFQKQGLMYVEETDQVEDCMLRIARQHMGVKPLIFPNSTGEPIEQGIIHSFTRKK